jgi:hypothetical protein
MLVKTYKHSEERLTRNVFHFQLAISRFEANLLYCYKEGGADAFSTYLRPYATTVSVSCERCLCTLVRACGVGRPAVAIHACCLRFMDWC